jgi:hypothetical protein
MADPVIYALLVRFQLRVQLRIQEAAGYDHKDRVVAALVEEEGKQRYDKGLAAPGWDRQ